MRLFNRVTSSWAERDCMGEVLGRIVPLQNICDFGLYRQRDLQVVLPIKLQLFRSGVERVGSQIGVFGRNGVVQPAASRFLTPPARCQFLEREGKLGLVSNLKFERQHRFGHVGLNVTSFGLPETDYHPLFVLNLLQEHRSEGSRALFFHLGNLLTHSNPLVVNVGASSRKQDALPDHRHYLKKSNYDQSPSKPFQLPLYLDILACLLTRLIASGCGWLWGRGAEAALPDR